MIVSCPSCTTRQNLGSHAQGAQGFTVSCRSCGHRWKELPVVDLEELPQRGLAKVYDPADEPDLDVRHLVEAAKTAQQNFALKRKARLKNIGGWASLGVVATFPFLLAAWVPETVVSAAPITIKAYQKLGYDINVYGLNISHIEQQNRQIDGKQVLLIKGDVSNPTNDVRKIPWLRFALNNDQGQELYQWTLDTASRPLRPGETTSFTTRVAAPPELAKNLQIRFAHQDEIGSKPSP
jgi:predicted Zn finger-like uncharacterized protein